MQIAHLTAFWIMLKTLIGNRGWIFLSFLCSAACRPHHIHRSAVWFLRTKPDVPLIWSRPSKKKHPYNMGKDIVDIFMRSNSLHYQENWFRKFERHTLLRRKLAVTGTGIALAQLGNEKSLSKYLSEQLWIQTSDHTCQGLNALLGFNFLELENLQFRLLTKSG